MEISDLLKETNDTISEVLSEERVHDCLHDLLESDSHWQVESFNRNVIKYMLYQFKAIAQAHRYEMMRKSSQKMSAYSFIESFLELNNHITVLLKKLSSNIVVQECFQEYLMEENIIDAEILKKQVYLPDYLLLNLLD